MSNILQFPTYYGRRGVPTFLCKYIMRRQHKTVSCVLHVLFMLIQSNFTLRSDPGKNNE